MRHRLFKSTLSFASMLIVACSAAPNEHADVAATAVATPADGTSCPSLEIRYDGGPVVQTPRIFVIYWGHEWAQPDWALWRDQLNKTWADFFTNPAFYAPVQRYGVSVGTYLGDAVNLDDVRYAQRPDVEAMIDNAINTKLLPVPDENTVFHIITSRSVELEQYGPFGPHGAFMSHRFFERNYGGTSVNVKYSYSVNEQFLGPGIGSVDAMASVAATALYEIMVDPLGTGYWAHKCLIDGNHNPWFDDTDIDRGDCHDTKLDGVSTAMMESPDGCVGPGPSSRGLIFPPPPPAPRCTLVSTCDNAFVGAQGGKPAGYQTTETITGTCASQASSIEQSVNGAWVPLAAYVPNDGYPVTTPNKFVIGLQSTTGQTTSGAAVGSSQSVHACAIGPGGKTCDDPATTLTIKACCTPRACDDTLCGTMSDGCGGTITCQGGCGSCKPQKCGLHEAWDPSICACASTCTTDRCRCESGGGTWSGNHCI